MESKSCNNCCIEKSISEFYLNKKGFMSECKRCHIQRIKEHRLKNREKFINYSKEYEYNNKEDIKKIKKEYYKKNKKQISEQNKKNRVENKEHISQRDKKYYAQNKNKLNEMQRGYYASNNGKEKKTNYYLKNKKEINLKKKNRRLTDPIYKLSVNTRTLIRATIKRQNHKKNNKTVNILGCSILDFKTYIERQFESWMTWKNHGNYDVNKKTWQLDHIIPISSAKTEEELIQLNHYTNFQPLLAIENIRKSNKLI
jgi:hypothetical protein